MPVASLLKNLFGNEENVILNSFTCNLKSNYYPKYACMLKLACASWKNIQITLEKT